MQAGKAVEAYGERIFHLANAPYLTKKVQGPGMPGPWNIANVSYYFSENPEREALDTQVALRPRMGVGFRNKILVGESVSNFVI
ncbi:hypothetical protein KSD_64540 [Ktedonobacter sp. SOSP1-85]|nr:hypothetical protein KSD_64540 [Ktedonobacter sp. SOSP1-85]